MEAKKLRSKENFNKAIFKKKIYGYVVVFFACLFPLLKLI